MNVVLDDVMFRCCVSVARGSVQRSEPAVHGAHAHRVGSTRQPGREQTGETAHEEIPQQRTRRYRTRARMRAFFVVYFCLWSLSFSVLCTSFKDVLLNNVVDYFPVEAQQCFYPFIYVLYTVFVIFVKRFDHLW